MKANKVSELVWGVVRSAVWAMVGITAGALIISGAVLAMIFQKLDTTNGTLVVSVTSALGLGLLGLFYGQLERNFLRIERALRSSSVSASVVDFASPGEIRFTVLTVWCVLMIADAIALGAWQALPPRGVVLPLIAAGFGLAYHWGHLVCLIYGLKEHWQREYEQSEVLRLSDYRS
ncbi:MAG: hypothetical protein U0136_17815 [Bdellovibrionota bacterium]